MTLKKLLLIIAGGIGVLGAILPWYTVSFFGYSQSANAFQMDAIEIILAILAIVLSACIIILNAVPEKNIKKLINLKDFSKVTMWAGIALTAVAVLAFIIIMSQTKGYGSISWGIWFIIIAGIASIVLTCLKNIPQLNKTLGSNSNTTSSKSSKQ